MIATLVVAGVYAIFLAGDQSVGSVEIRTLGVPALILASILTYRRDSLRIEPLVVMLAAITVWFSLATLWAHPEAEASAVSYDIAIMTTLLFLASLVIQRLPGRQLKMFWGVMYLSGLAFSAAGILLGAVDIQGRMTAFGSGSNVYARFVALGVVSAAVLLLMLKKGRWLVVLAATPMVYALIMSGSRGGMLSLLVALAVLALMVAGRGSSAMKRRILGAIIVGALAMYFIVWPRVEEYVNARFIKNTLEERNTAGRGDLAVMVLEVIDRDFLLGGGPGIIPVATEGQYVHAHNILLGALAEGGLVGGLLLVTALAIGFTHARTRDSLEASLWVLPALLILVSSMFSGTWYDTRLAWFFLLLGAETVRRQVNRPSAEMTATRVGRSEAPGPTSTLMR